MPLTLCNDSAHLPTRRAQASPRGPEERDLRRLEACVALRARLRPARCRGSCTLHPAQALCPGCAELNWRKRDEACDLRGRVALVTGGRMKIGFRVALKLLRCGATVICTTRFPMDGARRFAAQPDAASWLARLHIVGADFRDLKGLEAQLLERPALFEDSGPSARPAASVDARASPHRGAPPLQLGSLPWPQELASGCAEDDVGTCDRQEAMCDALPDLVPRLDMIINNACQTVRQP